MEYLYLGVIVNTHGIKGELRIISDFKFKEEVFKKGSFLYVGSYKDKEVINSYRVHKNYDMVTFEGISDINDALKYKGKKVYIVREEHNFDGIIYEDLIGLEVYENNNIIGQVSSIIKSHAHPIIVVDKEGKEVMIPFIDEFIKNVDLEKKRIEVSLIEGMIDEN